MEWTRGHTLGRGSSATVSIATTNSGEVLAVKSVDLSKSETLQREQQFLSILSSSPHVVSYKGCDITRESNKLMYNLLMQYMPGGTLTDAVQSRDGGLLKAAEISDYTRQILQGLEYIHSCGIVHCDIKGRNILIGETGAKIADLGCAKWVNQAAPLRGTPMYMAPEVARGEEQGFPADIWALGCTVIEMATGGSPWPNSKDPVFVLYRIAFSGELPEIPDLLTYQVKDFVSKCLIRDPRERWTATQLLKHPFLEQFNVHRKQSTIQDFNTGSPTSILDQDIWESMDQESVGSDVVGLTWSSSSARQRIKQLADKSGMPKWIVEEEINWTTIRSNGGGEGKGFSGALRSAVGDEMDVGIDDELLLMNDISDANVSCRSNRYRSSSSSSSSNSNMLLFRRRCKCEDCFSSVVEAEAEARSIFCTHEKP